MKAYLLPLAALLIAADAPPVAGPKDAAPADQVKKDLNRLQGTWIPVSGEGGGLPFAADDLKEMRLNVSGDKYTFKSPRDNEAGTLKLDPTKKPRALDIQITEGIQQGKVQLAVYDFDADTFKICFAPPGEARPTSFKTKAGSEDGLLVFHRQAK